MTLPAFDQAVIAVKDRPAYKVGPRCSNPTCRRFADHAHHIVRRSALGGDFAWIEHEGLVLGNLTGLCADCHEDITGIIGGHRAAIRFIDGNFHWCSVRERWGQIDYTPLGLLHPQPPTPETLTGETPRPEPESESCPTCGHKRRRGSGSATAPGPRRLKKTWTVKVPADQENGAEVLDTMVDDLALALGFSDEKSALRRYHTLVPVLFWAQQNKAQFIKEIEAVTA